MYQAGWGMADITSVYTPNDVAVYTMEVVDARRSSKHEALATTIGTLDMYMRPVLPGEVIFILANTGHGKTSLAQFWARQVVKQLERRDKLDEMVVFVSWETLVEELGLYDLCGMTGVEGTAAWYGDIDDEDVQKLRIAAMKRACMPLWVQGRSIKRRRREGAMTMGVVRNSLKAIEDLYKVRPAIVFLDYLQRIHTDKQNLERRLQVLRNVDEIDLLAKECACPVVVTCQASRDVLNRSFKLPDIGDGQETSRIEQDADKLLAMWYVSKTEAIGTSIEHVDVPAAEDMVVMGIRKQRHAASGQVFPIRFDAARNTFTSWE